MAFQRSYSKVWWGSDNQHTNTIASGSSLTSGGYYYSLYSQQHQLNQQQLQFNGNNSNGFHSLDYNNSKGGIGNLSRIQEVDDENNISKLSWEKHDSPGSLRSQDSGFSDNEESHSTRSLGGRSSKTASPSAKSDISARSLSSPTTSAQTIETPPTVIRRVGKSQFYSPLVNVSRRISFTGSPTKNYVNETETTTKDEYDLKAQLDSMQVAMEASMPGKKLLFDENDASKLITKPMDKDEDKDNDKEAATRSHNSSTSSSGSCNASSSKQLRRRKRVVRKATKPLTPTRRLHNNNDDNDEADEDANDNVVADDDDANEQRESAAKRFAVPEYNNETVYLGEAPPPYNNETVTFGGADTMAHNSIDDNDDGHNNTLKYDECMLSPIKAKSRFTASTSTPKAKSKNLKKQPKYSALTTTTATTTTATTTTATTTASFFAEDEYEYENPLLNGHSPALQSWLHDLRQSYDNEVMSTLQTKSIAQEAFKNLTITTNTVAKLIRQLQQRALYMQSDFERIERILCGAQAATLHEALATAEQLLDNVAEFTKVLERRAVFFSDTRAARKKYDDNIEQIRIVTKDTRYSLERQHYINLESLLDDVQVLKRFLLITVRLVFERMVRVIVQSIEQARCDLMLRANINMIATLTNIDYDGFASLTDAFVQNEAVRALLMVCLDHKLSSVRALALRALATICCGPNAIAQLGACGGIEILRDILHVKQRESTLYKRSDTERREAVSLLTQITAAWHGPEHRVDGLKDCIETIVEGLTDLLRRTECSQTLLLCAATLNNLSRIEVTSHYSIMSNEAIFKLIEAMEHKQTDNTIFHYEQIVGMLHNMSLNKKCHSHLANGIIINFITSAYQTEFYKSYNSRAESDAQRRTIKTILHTLTRLVHDTSLGVELLEQQRIPEFFKLAIASGSRGFGGGSADADADDSAFPIPRQSSHSRNTSQTLQAKGEEDYYHNNSQFNSKHMGSAGGSRIEGSNVSDASVATAGRTSITSGLKLNLTRQESFV